MINNMGYTTFVPDPDKKPSSLERLDWMLEDASARGNEVYILAVSKLHEKTGEKVAIVRYDPAAHTCLDIREAMDVTGKGGDPWHLYDPNTESIDALIKN